MPHRLRKVRKQRGSRTHGWGQVGQHRGGGSRGGHGKAGRHKHKWSYVVKHEPHYFGKHGFHRPMSQATEAINVGELDELVEGLLTKGQATKEEGGVFVDLNLLGYDKLLGRGKATRALIVKVRSSSESAVRKIEEAGGQVVLPD
ncbi:MAG: uL15 family ribosomal protein [Candidatus Bathyarchaeia archaeon]